MPKYELMYIISSNIADDQIPTVTAGVLKFITDFGGTVIKEDQMGKKKLAYPIKKTKNGFYTAVTFEMEGSKVNELETKVRTAEGIIRHLVVNLEEAMRRMAKDVVAQEKMNKSRAMNAKAIPVAESVGTTTVTAENLDQKIEQALSEDLSNI